MLTNRLVQKSTNLGQQCRLTEEIVSEEFYVVNIHAVQLQGMYVCVYEEKNDVHMLK